jgi:AGZA family xanthine/uracil permease-like MFS transporter
VLERLFHLRARGTTAAREVRGALATFLTMAYIVFANPAILSAAGMPREPVIAATAAASALCSLLMGLGANFPIALAPGMGLNAVIAYQVSPAAGSWQTALGLVVLDGLTMLVLVLVGFREGLMRAIPRDLRRAIGVGFIAFIGLVNARLTYSISHGIGYGFITYVAVQLLLGRPRDVHPLMYVAAAGFAADFLIAP